MQGSLASPLSNPLTELRAISLRRARSRRASARSAIVRDSVAVGLFGLPSAVLCFLSGALYLFGAFTNLLIRLAEFGGNPALDALIDFRFHFWILVAPGFVPGFHNVVELTEVHSAVLNVATGISYFRPVLSDFLRNRIFRGGLGGGLWGGG